MRKILLLICIAFVVLCYGYPCFILPFGEYKYEETVAEVTTTYSMKFGFDGKATMTIDDISTDYNYKLKGNNVILSEDEEFGNSDDNEIVISSMYKLGEAVNSIGMFATIGGCSVSNHHSQKGLIKSALALFFYVENNIHLKISRILVII